MQGNGPDVSRRLSDMTLAEKMAKFKNAAGKIDTDEMTRSLSFPLEEDSLMTRESLPLKDKMQVWICKTGSVSVWLVGFVQLFVREQAVEHAEKSGDEEQLKVC